jgi:hypothetical protein
VQIAFLEGFLITLPPPVKKPTKQKTTLIIKTQPFSIGSLSSLAYSGQNTLFGVMFIFVQQYKSDY